VWRPSCVARTLVSAHPDSAHPVPVPLQQRELLWNTGRRFSTTRASCVWYPNSRADDLVVSDRGRSFRSCAVGPGLVLRVGTPASAECGKPPDTARRRIYPTLGASMSQSLTQVAERRSGALDIARQAALVIGASLFVAVCAHIYLPLPGTPVPLTVQNLAVLLVGLSLGSRRGFLAMALYLAEGASGLPVFSPTGPGGIAQLIGPTAGYLIAYPFVAALAGFIFERGKPTFSRAAIAAISGEIRSLPAGSHGSTSSPIRWPAPSASDFIGSSSPKL